MMDPNTAKALAMIDMQDAEIVKGILARQAQLETKRGPWEQAFRDIDRRVNPVASGGFGNRNSPGDIRGLENFDSTAQRHLGRATAMMGSVTVPSEQRWHGAVTTDPELNKIDEVKLWCEAAVDRVFACRYNPLAGFTTQILEDWRQSLSYGTAALWTGEKPGYHLVYKAIHLAKIWIDEDNCGRVDIVHRKHKMTLRQMVQEYGEYALPERLRKRLRDPGGVYADDEIELLSVVRPNGEWNPFDSMKGMRFESITIIAADNWILRRKGFRTMPMLVNRHVTSPGDIYGRSPAFDVMGSIKTVNEIAKTMLRQMQKSVDPAWALHEDLDLTILQTKPGGLNPGMLDDRGEFLAKPLPVGDLAIGMEAIQAYRQEIASAYWEEFFRIMSVSDSARWTATQVLEMAQKQGVLITPVASRFNTEKAAPMFARELDLLMEAGQLPELPEVMREAGAKLQIVMENPLSRMARAEEAAGFARWVEMAVQLAPFDEGVIDIVDAEAGLRGVAEVLGIRPSWINSPDQISARRAAREEAKQQQQLIEAVPQTAGAALDLARANQIAGAV
jgi:hypothetical protein